MTHAAFLTVLQLMFPTQDPSELARYSTEAQALATAHAEFLPKWPRGGTELAAAQLTIIRFESGNLLGVHDGSIRGPSGEVCLMQIHPTNGTWRKYSDSFEALAGVDLEATTACIRTGTASLVWAANRCIGQRYRKNWAPAMMSSYHLGGQCWASPERFKRAMAMRNLESSL